MSEVESKPLFDQITIDQMRANEAMTKVVLSVVRDACRHSKGRYTVESVADGLNRGDMVLWGVLYPPARLEATVVTKAVGDTVEVLIAGPDFESVSPFLERIASHARSSGAKRITIMGPTWFKNHLDNEWFVREVRYERHLMAAL